VDILLRAKTKPNEMLRCHPVAAGQPGAMPKTINSTSILQKCDREASIKIGEHIEIDASEAKLERALIATATEPGVPSAP
jgi:hypothetical protein